MFKGKVINKARMFKRCHLKFRRGYKDGARQRQRWGITRGSPYSRILVPNKNKNLRRKSVIS